MSVTSKSITKPLIMGILNVTPDSFSDKGKYFNIENAIKHVKTLMKEGADILDIGGESTRPGAIPVSEEEELERVVPVIEEINQLRQEVRNNRHPFTFLISIDTYKSKVAKEAIKSGADIINDVSGLTKDPDMVQVAARAGCKVIIVHNKGIPATKPVKSKKWKVESIVNEVYEWLKKQTDYAIQNGVKRENIIIDPGIGFGKTPEEDLSIIKNLQELKLLGFPILIGHSRKSFIKKLFGSCDLKKKNQELTKLAIANGANIIRIHQIA